MRRWERLASLGTLVLMLGAQDARAAPTEITMFGASWCGPCRAVKSFLEKNKLSFRYRDIDREDARAEFMRVSGGNSGIPLTFVGQEKINGANLPRLRAVLEREHLLQPAAGVGKEGVEVYGGYPPTWWQAQFRDLRERRSQSEAEVRELERVAADDREKELLARKKSDLVIVAATLDQLDNDASKVALPRAYRE
jgi:glutaredoxin